MPSTTSRKGWGRGWGRGPLVAAGTTLFWVLGALAALAVGALSDELLSGAIVAALLLLMALASLVVLAVLLVRDRFPREVMARLDEIEARLGSACSHEIPAGAPAAAPVPPMPPPVATTEAGQDPPPPEEVAVGHAAPRYATQDSESPPATATGPTPPRVSWELLLGGRGLAVIGGVVLLIAVGLFLKFGWDQGWFRPSPAGRVALGLAVGVVLLALGEIGRRHARYDLLSQALTAAGLGAVYVSVWAAHGLYHLVGAVSALVLLATAAMAGVILAAATRGRSIATLSIVGGLLAPVVVDLPPQPPIALYVFLLVLLGGAAAVAALRRWPELGPIATGGVAVQVLIAFDWTWPNDTGRLVDAGFLLAAIILLVAVSLGFAWRRGGAPGVVELATLAAASIGGWGAGLARLAPLGEVTGGAWTVTVLLVELIAAHVVLTRIGERSTARWLFLALAGILLVALPPVLWDGAWVAAAWALEALVLVVASSAPVAGWAGSGIAVMAAFAALEAVDGAPPAQPFDNLEWLLRGVATAALVVLLVLVERWLQRDRIPVVALRIAAAPAATITALAWLMPEIEAWTHAHPAGSASFGLAAVLYSALLAAIGAGLLAGWRQRTSAATWLSGLLAMTASLLWAAELVDLGRWRGAAVALPIATGALVALLVALGDHFDDRRRRYTVAGLAVAIAVVAIAARLRAAWPGPDVVAAGIVPALIGAVATAALLLAAWRLPAGGAQRTTEITAWMVAVAASSRLLATALALAPAVPDPASARAGLVALSVLWGGVGLALVLAGLASDAPQRRYAGLALLVTTVLKVFAYDLASAPTVLRIVAFLVTGLALLAGAWLYARYRERLEPPG